MIISDLNHLETISEDTTIMGGAGVTLTFEVTAYGDSSVVTTTAKTSARVLPHDGSIAHGKAFTIALASDPIDATATVSLSGDAEGTKTIIKTQTHYVDKGTTTMAIGHITVKAITPPSPS